MSLLKKMNNLSQGDHHPFSWAGLLVGVLLVMTLAPAARAASDELAAQRWKENSHGLSLRLPLGAQTLKLSSDDAILRIAHPLGYRVTLYVKQSTRDLTLDEVVTTAVQQAARSATTVRKVEDPRDVKLGSLEGRVFTFAAPDVTPPAVVTQVFVLLNAQKVLIVELNAQPTVYERARGVFDQVLASFDHEDPEKIIAQRKEMLAAGEKWVKSLTPQQVHQALVAEQWLRVTDSKGDIGYMRIRQSRESHLQTPGVRIDVQARLIVDNTAYDTLSNYFVSDEADPQRRQEVWSVRTTARPMQAKPSSRSMSQQTPQEQSWAETGLLSGGVLSLTRESPNEKKPFEWDQLPPYYISQVHALLLPALLSPADKEPLAFYAYYGNSGNLALRTERVEPTKDGGYRVLSRPSPEQQDQVTYFDAQGKMLKRVLPGGQVMLPATAQEIVSRWKLQQ